MTELKPKVAVITRTKDRGIFLERAIDSVASQTWTNYVHVIVNDGGSEVEVQAIVDTFESSIKEKIQLFHRASSSNAPDTIFNESIDRVDSEYFVIHDDDDSWHPDFLSTTVKYLDAHEQLGAVVVRTDKIIEEQRLDSIKELRRTSWMPDIKVINLYRQCIDNQFTPISTLFRREAYEAVGKFDATLPVVGDWEFGVRLLKQYDADFINPGYALAYYHHRKYKQNSTGNSSFAGNDKHRYYTNLVMNRNLRQELESGQFGVGYIMSQLKYNQTALSLLVSKFLPKSIVERLKKRTGN